MLVNFLVLLRRSDKSGGNDNLGMVRVGGVDACWFFFSIEQGKHDFKKWLTLFWLGGLGDWRTDGCHITGVFRNFTTVHCSHLSIFAIIEVTLQIIVSALVSQKNNEEIFYICLVRSYQVLDENTQKILIFTSLFSYLFEMLRMSSGVLVMINSGSFLHY